MGGLEPPTSASQTRRAGRLRYTPADKSIIRSMSNRQEPYSPCRHQLLWLIILPLWLIVLSACQQATIPASTPTPVPQTITSQPETTPESTNTPIAANTAAPSATPTENCLEKGGTLQKGSFFSEIISDEFHYQVYLPPCYLASPQQNYPVVYLLHGLSYTNEQWLQLGLVKTMDSLVAARAIPPYIVVLPEESEPDPPQTSAFPNALITDLIPWIDSRYNTRSQKTYRCIGGVSRGAAWAVHIGFEHYQDFNRIGAHSLPLFQADQGKLIQWMQQIPPKDQPQVLIDIGRNDQEWPTAKFFADLLDQYAFPHEWYFFDGDHDAAYWSDHLDMYLIWYAQNW